MLRGKIKRGGDQNAKARGYGRFQRAPREELKFSVKVASPGCFLLQYRADGANDVAVWRKRLNVPQLAE